MAAAREKEFSDQADHRTWQEDHLFELFRILQPLTQKYLRATHLLTYLPFLRANASRITKTERKSALDAAKLLFNFIVNSDEPEKWNKFAHALKEAEFQSVYKICYVCERRNFVYMIEIFDLLCMDFADHGVDILNLSMGMMQLNSLSQSQFERIKIVFHEGGESAATLEFLSCLPDSIEIWLKNLLACLYAVNKINLCQLIKMKGFESDICTRGDLEALFYKYQKDIIKRVRPQDIMSDLKSYDLFPDMPKNSMSPMDEMQTIFSHIQKSKVRGKWRSFLYALSHSGYEFLYETLMEEKPYIDDSGKVKHIAVMTPSIMKYIDMNPDLLSEVKHLLINEQCKQEIQRRQNQYGNIAAAEMLLENIHRFKHDWYRKFLKILADVGQKDVAYKIDPDLECILKTSGKLYEVEDESKQPCPPKKCEDEYLCPPKKFEFVFDEDSRCSKK